MPLPKKYAVGRTCPKVVVRTPHWTKEEPEDQRQRVFQVDYQTFQDIKTLYSAYFELMRQEARFHRYVRKQIRDDYKRYRRRYVKDADGKKKFVGIEVIPPVPRPVMWSSDLEYIVELYHLARMPGKSEDEFKSRITHRDIRLVKNALRALRGGLMIHEESVGTALRRILGMLPRKSSTTEGSASGESLTDAMTLLAATTSADQEPKTAEAESGNTDSPEV